MIIAIAEDWFADFGKGKYDIIYQNVKWKCIAKCEYAYTEWGIDYYYGEFELVE